VIFKETGTNITGNQINLASSRIDFSLESFDKTKVAEYVGHANRIIKEGHLVETSILPRAQAMKIPNLVRLAMRYLMGGDKGGPGGGR
jgi:misacylated tRNA(Ala) deacylase